MLTVTTNNTVVFLGVLIHCTCFCTGIFNAFRHIQKLIKLSVG